MRDRSENGSEKRLGTNMDFDIRSISDLLTAGRDDDDEAPAAVCYHD